MLGDRPLPCPTLTRALAPATLAFAALAGCAMTTYRPTEPRPVLGPGVLIDIVSVRGAADKAEVLLRTQQPTLIGPVSLSSADHESCHHELPAQSIGRDVRVAEGEQAPFFVVNGAETVFVDLSGPARPEGPNAFLDFKIDTGSQQGCIRVPLTAAAADQTMWRADSPPWSLSLGVRIDHPLAPLGGTGARLTSELRVLRPLGPVRGFFGFTLGGAGCRGAQCPPDSPPQGEEDESVTNVFIHCGGELGLDRRFELGGGRALVATLGGNISAFHISGPPDWTGDKSGAVAGAFASLTLFALGGASAIPGFAPEARRLHSGPELFVHRLTAFGRGPTESAWVVGFGWRLEGTN